MSRDSDDDEPQLSAHTLAALNEFLAEQQILESDPSKVDEDWQLSQFWYNEKTAHTLARACFETGAKSFAFMCSPTAFKAFLADYDVSDLNVYLFEFARRFEADYPDNFVFYDYRNPEIPKELLKSVEAFLIDPPFLSDECFEKVATVVNELKTQNAKIIACTGAVMESKIRQLFGAEMVPFIPEHERKLANEFRCFTTFPSPVFGDIAD